AGGSHLFARANLAEAVHKSPIRVSPPERFHRMTGTVRLAWSGQWAGQGISSTATHTVAHTVIPSLCIVCTVRLEEDLPITLGVSRLTALSPSVRQGTLTTLA